MSTVAPDDGERHVVSIDPGAAVFRICDVLDQFTPNDALLVLVEAQAIVLADLGIAPRTAEFERLAIAHLARLAERTHIMRTALVATAH